MTRITLSRVSKTYPGNAAPSVADLDLDVRPGEFLCLLGPSGCGKSTTLRMIAGLEAPSAGRITIGDRVVDDVPAGTRIDAEHRGLGLVFQNYALWPHLTVRENVAFGPRVQRVARTERHRRVTDALEALAITPYADRYPNALSGGQQQRVSIARTLAAQPDIMLLDEPLSNLDARLRLEMRAEFQRIHRETGTTMVFVTHDQFEAMTLATRIVVMHQGTVQQIGDPLDIYDRPANRFVAEFMGSPPINMIERVNGTPAAVALDGWLWARGSAAASVGIRPEAWVVSAPDVDRFTRDEMFGFEATVTAILPTGGSWIIEAHDGAQRHFATATHRPPFTPGDTIRLSAPTAALHCFGASDERVELEGRRAA